MTRYLRTETVGGLILLAATAIALLWANSPIADSYHALREFHLGPLTVDAWAKDGLLALFFYVAGLELKRELVVGELADRKAAVLPVAAALGGMIVPALLALAISGDDKAWAIPVATDIAFALAVLAITGSGLPATARIFLLSLAVVDDLGAIVVIAVAFSTTFNLIALGAAIALLAAYWFLQRRRVRSPWLYVPLAVATWFAVHEAGVHATIAGVALGLLTRVKADPGEAESPAVRLEHRLQPWSAGVAVPVFALFAAGVPIGADAFTALVTDAIPIAVVVGLLVGKLVGVLGASVLAVTTGLAAKPRGLGWRDMAAVAMLGGVGFTVSLLMAELALTGEAADHAKAAVLLASAAASLLGAALVLRRSRVHRTANL